MTTNIYKNKIPVENRLVFDDNQRIKHHYISFFESNVNTVKHWKIFNPMLKKNLKSNLRMDEETYEILNFTKWKVIEYNNDSIELIEAMVW